MPAIATPMSPTALDTETAAATAAALDGPTEAEIEAAPDVRAVDVKLRTLLAGIMGAARTLEVGVMADLTPAVLARFEARSAATPGNAKLAVDFRIERRHLYDLAHYQAKAADGITNQRQHTFETAVKRAIRAAMLAFDQPTSEALALAWIRINRPTRQALIQISGLGEAECDRLLAMQEIHTPQVTDKALARYAFGPALYAINKAGKLVARDDVIRPQIATIALDESGTPRAGKAFDNPNTDYAPIAYGVVDDLFDRTFGNGGARAPKEEATAPTANAVDLADLESKVKEGAITMQEATTCPCRSRLHFLGSARGWSEDSCTVRASPNS